MGVIFLKSESHQFISDCQSNIQNGQDVIQDLKSGSTHLMQAIDGKTLSGAAYTAGKGLFGELIVPVITRFGQAIEEIQADLKRYSSADQAIQAASTNKLDEDKLTQQIRECEAYRQTMKMTADALNSQAFEILAMSNPVTAMVALADQLFNIRGKLTAYLTSLDQDIEKLKNDLRLLQNFVSQTQGLFRDSTRRIKLAMQGISVLGKMMVNADGRYRFPKGMDKSWFSNIYDDKKTEDIDKRRRNEQIKFISDLYKKNPAEAIKRIENDENLFGYIIWGLDKCPDGLQNVVLGIFTTRENWDGLPKKYVTKLVNNPKFAYYVSKLSINAQGNIYGALNKLSSKGWDVLAPLGYVTSVLSKSSVGAKILDGSKTGLKMFKKLDKVKTFMKGNKVFGKTLGYAGDILSVTSYSYEEYTNPDSPAYGNESKALYGGLNLFLYSAGPIEGAEYGGPVGGVAGTINTVWYYGKYKIINNSPKILGNKNGFNWNSDIDKQKWLNQQYENYGKYDSSPTEKHYRSGIQSESGSPNFNPGTEYRSDTNSGVVNPNQSPYSNWGIK